MANGSRYFKVEKDEQSQTHLPGICRNENWHASSGKRSAMFLRIKERTGTKDRRQWIDRKM